MEALQCEVCGRRITKKSYKAIIEGARLIVCSGCAALGSISWEIKPESGKIPTRIRKPPKTQLRTSKKRQSPLQSTFELVEDYGNRIRQARESQRLSHEDLGKKLNEKVSVLKKLENNKMRPDNRLVKKLQHVLKIRLLVPLAEKEFPKQLLNATRPAKTFTLGDLIQSKKKSEATK